MPLQNPTETLKLWSLLSIVAVTPRNQTIKVFIVDYYSNIAHTPNSTTAPVRYHTDNYAPLRSYNPPRPPNAFSLFPKASSVFPTDDCVLFGLLSKSPSLIAYQHWPVALRKAVTDPCLCKLPILDSSIEMPDAAATPSAPQATPSRKTPGVPEKKYKCQFCNRAFSRSEHRSRHERSRKFKFPTLVQQWGRGVVGSSSLTPIFFFSCCCCCFCCLHPHFNSANTIVIILQTPKSVLSNAENAEALLCDGTYYCDTIGPSMPKMEESHSLAKSSVVRPQNQRHPKPLRPSGTWNWTRQRWNR